MVIAIIGILSGIIVGFVVPAKSRGTDAAIKQDMVNLRTQIEYIYGSPPIIGYGNTVVCSGLPSCAFSAAVTCAGAASVGVSVFGNSNISVYLDKIESLAGVVPQCYARGEIWSLSSVLRGGGAWCMDSTGASKPGIINTDGVCG